MRAGRLRHRVDLQKPVRVHTANGWTEDWQSYASRVPAEILPATPSLVERRLGQTVQTPLTHLVTIRYRPDVQTTHLVKVGSRELHIRGLQNVRELNRELVLACEELAS